MLTLWWLKVKRAQKHMVDIHREAWRYASRHPYSFSRIRLPDSKRNVLYRMRITEQSNPMIAIMLGDFIHNLRCALDYIIVANVPRRRQNSASFPILLEDIFATDMGFIYTGEEVVTLLEKLCEVEWQDGGDDDDGAGFFTDDVEANDYD